MFLPGGQSLFKYIFEFKKLITAPIKLLSEALRGSSVNSKMAE